MMRAATVCVVVVAGLGSSTAQDAAAQDPSRVREEVATTLQIAADKMIALAEAMPQEAYAYRPGEGVRSVSEVYMHVAGTNYWFPTVVGGVPPEGSGVTARYATVPPMEQVTDKAAVVAALRASFAYVIDFVRNAPADRLDEDIDMFGRPTTYRGVLLETAVHLHEHLGQSIAYARVNGVTPPWS